MKIELFDYELPRKYIAQKPIPEREKSRLLILERSSGSIRHDFFYNIGNYINPKDVLVINETKVLKCRFFGVKEKTGARIECLVLRELGERQCLALIKPFKRVDTGTKVFLVDTGDTGRSTGEGTTYFIIKSKLDSGEAVVEFSAPISIIYDKFGKIPLPPYIKNQDIDESRYQTVYASMKGSSAAPTAGLHFTKELIEKLQRNGVKFARLRLDIGLDTFKPIKEDEIEKHKMHREYYEISKEEVDKIIEAKRRGGNIVAVGTTTTRVLESVATRYGKLKEDRGFTDLYIYPGYNFKVVDNLITNFHLPRSTLLVMVCAFAGRDNILNAYEEAKRLGYRFFSFGDCMLIK